MFTYEWDASESILRCRGERVGLRGSGLFGIQLPERVADFNEGCEQNYHILFFNVMDGELQDFDEGSHPFPFIERHWIASLVGKKPCLVLLNVSRRRLF